MDIDASKIILLCIVSLRLSQEHIVVLNTEVKTSGDTNVVHTNSIGFTYSKR